MPLTWSIMWPSFTSQLGCFLLAIEHVFSIHQVPTLSQRFRYPDRCLSMIWTICNILSDILKKKLLSLSQAHSNCVVYNHQTHLQSLDIVYECAWLDAHIIIHQYLFIVTYSYSLDIWWPIECRKCRLISNKYPHLEKSVAINSTSKRHSSSNCGPLPLSTQVCFHLQLFLPISPSHRWTHVSHVKKKADSVGWE